MLQVSRKCKFEYVIIVNFDDEVQCDVVPLDVCKVVLATLMG